MDNKTIIIIKTIKFIKFFTANGLTCQNYWTTS